jgi:Virulence-associated protein E
LLIANEGFNKSSFLTVLYGRRNVLAEDILDLTTKEQSEKLRNGIMCVEFADTLGDDKRTNARKIKAFITRQDDIGRDAYGRVEDVEHIGRTCVYWHTGNNPHLLTSEEGNRRFAPMRVLGMMDLDLLRQERDQIWSQAVELEQIGRLAYEAEMRSKGIPVNPGDEIYPDIMLEEKYWNEGRQLTNQAMVKTGYEDCLSGVILWPEVNWVHPDAKSKLKRYSISILSSVIKDRLQVPDYRWNGEAQKVSRLMKGKVELYKSECEGLTSDICWAKTDTLKKAGELPTAGGSSRPTSGTALTSISAARQR